MKNHNLMKLDDIYNRFIDEWGPADEFIEQFDKDLSYLISEYINAEH